MSTVEEIERAIERLPSGEVSRLTAWLVLRDSAEWNRQLAEDSETGRLDFLFEEAKVEEQADRLRDWPPQKK
jgi:hypothetical protein